MPYQNLIQEKNLKPTNIAIPNNATVVPIKVSCWFRVKETVGEWFSTGGAPKLTTRRSVS
jgi:hypothetical protein